MSKKELVKLLQVLFDSYNEAKGYADCEAIVGDWALEVSSGTFLRYERGRIDRTLMKIEKISPEHGEWWGTLPDGSKQHWTNAEFYRLPDRCQKLLNESFTPKEIEE